MQAKRVQTLPVFSSCNWLHNCKKAEMAGHADLAAAAGAEQDLMALPAANSGGVGAHHQVELQQAEAQQQARGFDCLDQHGSIAWLQNSQVSPAASSTRMKPCCCPRVRASMRLS
jgi:hypothetical protein